MARNFADRLNAAIQGVGNPVVVGIDPRPDLFPETLRPNPATDATFMACALESFSLDLLDVLRGKVAAIKFQCAFYERYGVGAMGALQAAMRKAHELGLLVILDGKRNDIGSTAEAYARAYLTEDRESEILGGKPIWGSDALTVNPYLGSDGVTPFIESASATGKGVFVLVRTSNPSAREFQDLECDGKPVYRHVADRLVEWARPYRGASGYSLVGAVVGATYPQELAELRAALPGVIMLVPGYGAQGGTAADVAAAFDENGLGAIINNSRGLTYAYRELKYRDRFGSKWQRAIEAALRDMIDDLAANTPAGRLRTAAGPSSV